MRGQLGHKESSALTAIHARVDCIDVRTRGVESRLVTVRSMNWLVPFRRFWTAHVDALERHLGRMGHAPRKGKIR